MFLDDHYLLPRHAQYACILTPPFPYHPAVPFPGSILPACCHTTRVVLETTTHLWMISVSCCHTTPQFYLLVRLILDVHDYIFPHCTHCHGCHCYFPHTHTCLCRPATTFTFLPAYLPPLFLHCKFHSHYTRSTLHFYAHTTFTGMIHLPTCLYLYSATIQFILPFTLLGLPVTAYTCLLLLLPATTTLHTLHTPTHTRSATMHSIP